MQWYSHLYNLSTFPLPPNEQTNGLIIYLNKEEDHEEVGEQVERSERWQGVIAIQFLVMFSHPCTTPLLLPMLHR